VVDTDDVYKWAKAYEINTVKKTWQLHQTLREGGTEVSADEVNCS
jgi:hypothetical protein